MKTTFQYPNAAANFQLGFMTSFGQGNYELVNDRNHFPGLYAQDSWKANRRFTINYGVRWEPFAPWGNNVSKQSGAGTGFGNVVKDSLRGPGLTNWDVAMIRYFPIWRETNSPTPVSPTQFPAAHRLERSPAHRAAHASRSSP